MCGIVGYIGCHEAAPILLEGLKRLEYRGYDSAGIAVLHDGRVRTHRSEGKLINLEGILRRERLTGNIGIGHTRWATHGRPTETNAHPHRAGSIVVVHNGIIENYLELRDRLSRKGAAFVSETDTEVVAHLVNEKVERGMDFLRAVRESVHEIEGSYALVFLHEKDPERLVVAKNSTPIVIGQGESENFVASDIPAILEYTRKVTFLDDGEIAEIRTDGYRIFDRKGRGIDRQVKEVTWDPITAQKGGYRHFMLKEIHEQPNAITDTLRGRLSADRAEVMLQGLELAPAEVERLRKVHLVACGTAWHAALVGKFFLEEIAGIPAEVDYGSEFRYRNPLLGSDPLLLLISQSGETADTLAAVETGRGKNAKVISICNVVDSTLARKSDGVFYTHAGPEISVASTKAFTTQIVSLYLLSVGLGRLRNHLSRGDTRKLVEDLLHLPQWMDEALKLETSIAELAPKLSHVQHFLYLGRGINYPIALEGALKLKEISYIHAEGYPAGEMKHGPIALIDEALPVVILLPRDRYFQKGLGNLREVESRGGRVIVLTDGKKSQLRLMEGELVEVPQASPFLMPAVLAVPLQLLAYHIAVHRGTDVDQPRNLAKSVTVE